MTNNQYEQRNFYRVSDHAYLEYQIISEIEAQRDLTELFKPSPHYQLTREFQNIEQESRQLLQSVAMNNKPLGNYLQSLEKRLNLLLKYMTLDDPITTQTVSHKISLSEGGLSFQHDNTMELDQLIALKLLIPAQTICIISSARVVNCEPEPLNTATLKQQNSYIIGLEFQNLREPDRKQLARYIMRKQAADKRQHINHQHPNNEAGMQGSDSDE